jgi:FkbM family methyltransferase
VKPTTPFWLFNRYKKKVLLRLVPLKKTTVDGLVFYSLRAGSPPQDPILLSRKGLEFHEEIDPLTGDIAIDVGANIGSYTLRLAKNFRRVVAFEPNPVVSSILRMNVAKNKIQNVTVEDTALSDVNRTLPIHIDSEREGVASLDPSRSGANFDRTVVVRVATLDDFALPGGKVDFVKIDVEGLEEQVLRGGYKLISEFRPVLGVEVHNGRIDDGTKGCSCSVCKLLKSYGYDVNVTGELVFRTPTHWTWAKPRS